MTVTPSAPSPSPSPARLLSSKVPKGRHLSGTNLLYDIHVRLPSEVQPQLEVTPITKYASDPGLVLGRQIAVNRNYICYGLKLGNIRILNINTALRSLLRGHTQRVTDMAFFAEDVHLLASASVDGRVFVWRINEGPDDEDKPQIFGKVVIALQIVGQESSKHPRVCWHPHKQEILMVAIGNRILKIDTIKVGKLDGFSAEEPLNFSVDKLIDGVQFVGKHDGEITELSMCQWLTTRIASASVDGTVKIWEDRKPIPLAVLRPHDGHPVYSATFLTAPHRPDHIVLITGGPLNREVKIWASSGEEGWLLPSDGESWQCMQTLELRCSAESEELSHGYKPTEKTINYSSSESAAMASCPQNVASSEVTFISESAVSGMEIKPSALLSGSSAENVHIATPPLPLSPRLSWKSSGFGNPSSVDHVNRSAPDHSVDHKVDTVRENNVEVPYAGESLQKGEDIAVFKHPTHLVTPSEILSTVSSLTENAQISQAINEGEAAIKDVVKNDAESVEVEVDVLGETKYSQVSRTTVGDNKEKAFYSQASDLGIQMARDFCVESYGIEGAQQANHLGVLVQADRLTNAGDGGDQNVIKNAPPKVGETDTAITGSPSPASAKGKKQKKKNSQVSVPSSPSASPYNSTDSSNEPGCSSGALSADANFPQLLAMRDMLEQSLSVQKEMQKQMNAIVSAPVNKEGKRLEASLGRSIEKAVKANTDALWARIKDENAKQEKLERDCMQQITNLITNCLNKDLPAMFEKSLKKEIAAVGPVVARAISPTLEKSISSAITESFQVKTKIQILLTYQIVLCPIRLQWSFIWTEHHYKR
ncbi:hypothetical protein V6Z11_D09G085300 [Gossypium hirsutum]